jgi:hypothetical protein
LHPLYVAKNESSDAGSRRRKTRPRNGSFLTRRWSKPDSNSQSHPRERVSFGDEPTQIPKATSWQTNGRRRLLAQDYDETAEDLEIGASEIRPPEHLPEGKRPR